MKNNPVAKFAHKVNKATVQRDRTKYHRKQKHKGDGRDDRHRPFSWPRPTCLIRFAKHGLPPEIHSKVDQVAQSRMNPILGT